MPNTAAAGAAANNANKKVIFKNCLLFTDCISKINNTQLDYANYIDVAMPMYNFLEYINICLKTSESLWQFNRDKPGLNNNDDIVDFPAKHNSILFKFKEKITGQTGNVSTKDVDIMAPLKYPSKF